MITLLGALLGFVGSIFPELIKWLNKKEDNKHELALTDKQIEMQKLLGTQKMEEINVQADIEEFKALHQAPATSGIRWVDGLSGSVRPIITYLFFIAYALVKYAQYELLTSPEMLPWLGKAVTMDWKAALVQLWTEEDAVLFSTIMAFWFGSRGVRHLRGKN